MRNGLKKNRFNRNRYQYILESIKDVVWELDRNLMYTFISPNVYEMTGYLCEEMIGKSMLSFLTDASREQVIHHVTSGAERRGKGDQAPMDLITVEFLCKNGDIIWAEVSGRPIFQYGEFTGYIGSTRDVSEKKRYELKLSHYIGELRQINETLEKTALVDSLTGAYNRRKFDDELNSIIGQRDNWKVYFSLIFLDIDHFKKVNDRYGHKVGDAVLQRLSGLIRENLRVTDTLFRWGGEEFVIILPEADLENALMIAEKIRKVIHKYDFGIGQKVTVSLSVGEHKPHEDTDEVLVRLDNALFEAKSKGRNRVVAC